MKRLLHLPWIAATMASPLAAQIFVEKVFQVQQTVPDYGQVVDARTLSDFGMTSILDVNVGVSLQGAVGSTMRLGDYFVSLTYGTASEEERVAVLMNRPGVTAARPWGSSLSSANLTFNDFVGAPNAFAISTSHGTYAADGRLSVNPYASPSTFDLQAVTHGLSALNGSLLPSGSWSLLVADARQGGVGMLSSWRLGITGAAAESGIIDPGSGGVISDVEGAAVQEVKAGLLVSDSGIGSITARVNRTLTLSGGLSGAGTLLKTGNGALVLGGDSSKFTGALELSQGSLRIESSQALGNSRGIRVSGTGNSLILSQSSRLNAPITLQGVTTVLILDGSGTLGGPLTGDGGLRKVGLGATSLLGDNQIGGDVSVEEGTLSVNGSISGDGELKVFSGGVLKGSGFINVTTMISGVHAAGNSPGLQTFSSDLSYDSGIFEWELESETTTGRGISFDAVDVVRSLTVNNSVFKVIVNDLGLNSEFWAAEQTWDVFNKEADGTFSIFELYSASNLSSPVDYSTWGAFSFDSFSGDLLWAPIPEPSPTVFIALFLTLSLVKRRRG